MTEVRLRVNGRAVVVAVDDEDTPLLYVLRDELELKNARFGSSITRMACRWAQLSPERIKAALSRAAPSG